MSLFNVFDRWKTLVSARRTNKVVPVRTKCRYIFYTRYRQHLAAAIEFSFCSLFSSLRLPRGPLCTPCLLSFSLVLSLSLSFSLFFISFSLFGVCFADCCMRPAVRISWHLRLVHTTEFFLRRLSLTLLHSQKKVSANTRCR